MSAPIAYLALEPRWRKHGWHKQTCGCLYVIEGPPYQSLACKHLWLTRVPHAATPWRPPAADDFDRLVPCRDKVRSGVVSWFLVVWY